MIWVPNFKAYPHSRETTQIIVGSCVQPRTFWATTKIGQSRHAFLGSDLPLFPLAGVGRQLGHRGVRPRLQGFREALEVLAVKVDCVSNVGLPFHGCSFKGTLIEHHQTHHLKSCPRFDTYPVHPKTLIPTMHSAAPGKVEKLHTGILPTPHKEVDKGGRSQVQTMPTRDWMAPLLADRCRIKGECLEGPQSSWASC